MKKSPKFILVDADVVSHFITGGQILLLPEIFPFKIKMIDIVYQELCAFKKRKSEVDNLLNQSNIELMGFPQDDIRIQKEYAWIKSMRFRGDGESACMAVARFSKDIIASCNLKDIADYCKMHGIKYLTTMDFLCEALSQNKLSMDECNLFITRVINAGSKLPVTTMQDYRCRSFGL